MFDRHKLPCPIDGMSFKYSYKVKIFCDIDAIAMVSACLSSPGCFPEPVLWERKFPHFQFLILWISPLRGPKTFPTQKLSLSILVKVTQGIQNFSQTTFLIRRSWDRCWISLPSKLRVLLPFYIPWEAIDGHSFPKIHDKSILVELLSYDESLGKVWSLQDASSWPYQYTFQIPTLAPELLLPIKEEVFHSKHSKKTTRL